MLGAASCLCRQPDLGRLSCDRREMPPEQGLTHDRTTAEVTPAHLGGPWMFTYRKGTLERFTGTDRRP